MHLCTVPQQLLYHPALTLPNPAVPPAEAVPPLQYANCPVACSCQGLMQTALPLLGGPLPEPDQAQTPVPRASAALLHAGPSQQKPRR